MNNLISCLKTEKKKSKTDEIIQQLKAEINFKLEKTITYGTEPEVIVKQPAVFKLETDLSRQAVDILIKVVNEANSISYHRGEKEFINFVSLLRMQIIDFCFINSKQSGQKFSQVRTTQTEDGLLYVIAN